MDQAGWKPAWFCIWYNIAMRKQPAEDKVIRFQAIIAQVRTMADGGPRITLDLPENAINEAAKLMEAKSRGAILEVVIVPINPRRKPSKKSKPKAEVKQNWN